MKKSDISILVIDDESIVAEPIVKALIREGYTSRHVRDAELAMHELEVRDYHLVLIDCMLPKVNGLELAKQIANKYSHSIKLFLMSGIFKDSSFKKEALIKTKAEHFFEKPFNLEDLLEAIFKSFENQLDLELPEFQQLFSKNFNENPKKNIEIIGNLPTLFGFEVPMALSVLSACSFNGELILESPKNNSIIRFQDGQIYQVQNDDTESYFGVLLIENGFSTPEEVAKGLALDSQLPIGQKLWAINTLSPHAINQVHQEQLSIRLSKLIKAENYILKLITKTDDKSNDKIFITDPSYHRFLNDWISSKVKIDWLKTYFNPWLANPIFKGPNITLLNSFKKIALVNLAPDVLSCIEQKKTLSEIIEENNKPFIYQSILFLLLTEVIKLNNEKSLDQNFESSIKRLESFLQAINTKNFYEMLGVDKHSPKEKIQQAFHNLALTLHPDKVPRSAPEKLVKLSTEVFQKLSEAHQTLTNPSTKKKYDFEIEHGKAELIIKSDSLFERGYSLLNLKKYNEACDAFDEVYRINLFNDDFLIYYSWALLKRGAAPSQLGKLTSMIDEFINRIPQENRHNCSYFYVKGLYLKLTEDNDKAIVAFKHAFTLNPDFKPAQIEWMALENKKRDKSQSLTSGIANLFKRKSS